MKQMRKKASATAKISLPCPISAVATLVGDTYILLIIYNLLKKPMRFCELEHAIEGVSTRTLTAKLHLLQTEKIVNKNIINPTNTQYSLTHTGKKLRGVLREIQKYTDKN